MVVDKALGSIVARRSGTVRSWFRDASLRRFLTSAVWNAVSVGLSRVLNLLALILASRALGSDRYGQLGLVQNTMAMFGVFAGFGLGLTATQQVARWSGIDPVRTAGLIRRLQGFSLTTGLLAAAAAIVVAPWLATQTLSRPELSPVLQLGSLLILFNAFLGVQQGTFVGLVAVRKAALAQGIGGAALIVGMPLGAQWGGLQGCLAAQIAALGVQAAASQYLLKTICRERGIALGRPTPCWRFEGMYHQALPVALCSLLVMPVDWCVSVMLVRATGGFHEAGLYAVAWQWVLPVLLIPSVIGQSVLPLMGERAAAGDHRTAMRLLWTATLMNLGVFSPLAIFYLLDSRFLLQISGSEFVEGERTLQLLFAAAGCYAIQAPSASLLISQGWIWPLFVTNLLWAISMLALTILWAKYGAEGVAAGRLCSYVLHAGWTFALVWLMNFRRVAPQAA